MRRTAPATVPVVALALLLTACGGDAEPAAAPSEPAPSVASSPEVDEVEEPEPTESTEAEPDDEAQGEADACGLVSRGKLAAVFGVEVPEADGTDWGAGFVECVWEADDLQVRVSVVPAENLQSDFVDQLNGSQMAGLEDAVGFAGVVGIGHLSSGGWTTAVPNGDEGLLVGVRSGGATDDDALAREIIEEILAG